MPDSPWNDAIQWLKRATGNQPDAYSRITRTPIYKKDKMPEGTLATYMDKLGPLGGYISVPNKPEISPDHLRHEEGHAVFDQAGLSKYADELAPQVAPEISKFINRNPLYKGPFGGAPSKSNLANEGLGYDLQGVLGERTNYINKVFDKIKDPKLKERLYRLSTQMTAREFEEFMDRVSKEKK